MIFFFFQKCLRYWGLFEGNNNIEEYGYFNDTTMCSSAKPVSLCVSLVDDKSASTQVIEIFNPY